MSRRHVPLDRMPTLGSGTVGLNAAQVEAQRTHGFNDIVAQPASGWLVVARDTAPSASPMPVSPSRAKCLSRKEKRRYR